MSSPPWPGRPAAIEPPSRSARRRATTSARLAPDGSLGCRDVGAKSSNASRLEDGRIVVAFDDAGYRTLDVAACLEGNLLGREA